LAAGGAIAWMYRTRLNQAAPEIQLVARSEARAVASNDRESFLALQDPEDYAWRAVQEKRFGQLERVGLPANVPSREELYRAYEMRLAQALVFEASGRRLNMAYLSSEEFVRWEMAEVGLTGPFINEAISHILFTTPAILRQPVNAISLRTRVMGLDASPGEAALPLAFDFLEQQF
jgi:hypothetical protein